MAIERPARDFDVELAFGRQKMPNGDLMFGVYKYGSNKTVGTVEAAIQVQGGEFIFPQSPQRVRIRAGGDIADTAAGIGAQEIEVFGINGDGDAASEKIITTGAAASAWTTNTWWRVYRVRPSVVGEYDGVNQGDVDIENEGDLDLLIRLPALRGSTLHLCWTTGRNQQALISTLTLSVESNKTADIHIYTRENITEVGPPYTSRVVREEFDAVTPGLFTIPRVPYLRLPPLTDIFMTAQTPNSTAAVGGALSIIVAPA